MDEQRTVAAYVEEHGLEAPPAFRLLDLVAELGEIATEAAESTDYGDAPGELAVAPDEIGDALFALLALSESLDIEADAALGAAIEKYDERLADGDTPGSGTDAGA